MAGNTLKIHGYAHPAASKARPSHQDGQGRNWTLLSVFSVLAVIVAGVTCGVGVMIVMMIRSALLHLF